MIVAILILAATVCEMLQMWVERHGKRIDLMATVPPFRFTMWGHWQHGDQTWAPFWMIKLPSYEYEQCDFGRSWGWYQRVLVWSPSTRLWMGHPRFLGWRIGLLRCSDRWVS